MYDAKHILLVDDDGEARGASALVVTSGNPDARVMEVATAIDLVDAISLGGFQVVIVEPAVAWSDPGELVDCLSRHLPAARLVIFTRDPDPAADALAAHPAVCGWIHKEGFGSLLTLAQSLKTALVADADESEHGPRLMRLGGRRSRRAERPTGRQSDAALPVRADTDAHPPVYAPNPDGTTGVTVPTAATASPRDTPGEQRARTGAQPGSSPSPRRFEMPTDAPQPPAPRPTLASPNAINLTAIDDDGWPAVSHDRPPTLTEAAARRARTARSTRPTPPPIPQAHLGAIVQLSAERLRGPLAALDVAGPDLGDAEPRIGLHRARQVEASPSIPALVHRANDSELGDGPFGPLTDSAALCDEDGVETLDAERAIADSTSSRPIVRPPTPAQTSDPDAAMRAALDRLESSIGKHGALITWDPLPAALPLGELPLTEVIESLLGNAIKFRGRNAPRIHVGVFELSDGFEVSVADNGVGMPREAQRRVFRMFERAHGSTFEGDGVGLAVCKQIIEGVGGRIWLDSVPGVGTTVHFRLPCVSVTTHRAT